MWTRKPSTTALPQTKPVAAGLPTTEAGLPQGAAASPKLPAPNLKASVRDPSLSDASRLSQRAEPSLSPESHLIESAGSHRAVADTQGPGGNPSLRPIAEERQMPGGFHHLPAPGATDQDAGGGWSLRKAVSDPKTQIVDPALGLGKDSSLSKQTTARSSGVFSKSKSTISEPRDMDFPRLGDAAGAADPSALATLATLCARQAPDLRLAQPAAAAVTTIAWEAMP